MDPIAAGFWGAFFGTAALMLAISLAAFFRAGRRVALLAALSAVVSAAFVVAYLGWLPVEGAPEARLLAHVAILAAAILAPLLLSLLGLLRERSTVVRTIWLFTAIAVLVIGVGWILEPTEALVVSWISTFAIGTVMMVIALRATTRGNRLARTTVAGMSLMLLALGGLSWIALERSGSWPVHALSALASMGFLSVMAYATWERFSYLLELSEVMAHGPSYDPVTRMRSHSETGQMVGDIFFHRDAEERPVGVLAVCIGNLYALENLHGRAAFNHALFICAGRLRRCVPQTMEMGRLGEDGFLLLVPHAPDVERLEQLARQIRDRLGRPVSLSTSRDPAGLEAAGTAWVADVGIGVLGTSTQVRPSQAIATARAMARTAWSYGSRMAFFDQQAGQIAELAPRTRSPLPAATAA